MSESASGNLRAQQMALAQGTAMIQQGRLAEAEQICHFFEVLRRQPRHIDALHVLGLIAFWTNRAGQGVRLLRRAIELDPDVAALHVDLGVVEVGADAP